MLLSWVSEVAWTDDETDWGAAEAAYVQGGAARVVPLPRAARHGRGGSAADVPVAYAMRAGRE
jgi:hypothetical protein